MQLHPTMDKFYLSILDYAGMKVENGIFVNKNDKIGDMTIDGRHLAMPYFDNMKNPENRLIFHPLNENYTNPETTIFNLFKRRLVLELNLRLSSLMVSLVGVAGDVKLQQRIKSSRLIEMISSIGEVDLAVVESFLEATKASRKVNTEAFLFDIYLKKNGEINDTPYAAIGKLNFLMFNEINRALKDGDYKVFGKKLSKKDLLPMDTLFRVVFPTIDDPNSYTEGTDNKVFRYLNILLKTSYQVSSRMNEIADMLEELNEPALKLEEIRSNLDWVGCLEELYGMASEIRVIPSQTDLAVEASNKMKLDESKASAATPTTNTTGQAPAFDPSRAQQAAPMASVAMPPAPMQQPMMQAQPMQQPQQLSPEDIIRGSMGGGMAMPQMMPQMMPMMGQPMMQPQMQTPQWVLQEQMRTGQIQQPQQMMPMMGQPMMQPMMMPQQQVQQPQIINTPQGPMIMTPQGMVPAQMMQGQMMMQQPAQQGLAINPHFMTRSAAPFN